MSKATFKCYMTRPGPQLKRFQNRSPKDTTAAAIRLRTMAERLKGSGRNLADANNKSPTPANGEANHAD